MKAILFDLDNTLLDFFLMKKRCTQAVAQAMIKTGLKLPLKKTQEELFNKYMKNIEGERVFTKFLKEKKQFDENILAAGLNAYLKTKPKYLKTYPEVKQTLQRLKKRKVKLGLITNAPKLKAYQRLDSLELTNLFDFIIADAKKPKRTAFLKAIKLLKLKPEEILFVGDSIRLDMKGAKAVGMKTCLAKYGNIDKIKIKMDYKIRKFGELMIVVKDY